MTDEQREHDKNRAKADRHINRTEPDLFHSRRLSGGGTDEHNSWIRETCMDFILWGMNEKEAELQSILDGLREDNAELMECHKAALEKATVYFGALQAIKDELGDKEHWAFYGKLQRVTVIVIDALGDEPEPEPTADNLKDLRERANLKIEDLEEAERRSWPHTDRLYSEIENGSYRGEVVDTDIGWIAGTFGCSPLDIKAAIRVSREGFKAAEEAEHKGQQCE